MKDFITDIRIISFYVYFRSAASLRVQGKEVKNLAKDELILEEQGKEELRKLESTLFQVKRHGNPENQSLGKIY